MTCTTHSTTPQTEGFHVCGEPLCVPLRAHAYATRKLDDGRGRGVWFPRVCTDQGDRWWVGDPARPWWTLHVQRRWTLEGGRTYTTYPSGFHASVERAGAGCELVRLASADETVFFEARTTDLRIFTAYPLDGLPFRKAPTLLPHADAVVVAGALTSLAAVATHPGRHHPRRTRTSSHQRRTAGGQ